MRIACVGEAMVELSLHGEAATLGFAGDTLNTAIYLRRGMGEEHEVAFLSKIGADVLSERLARFVAEEGVSVAGLQRDAERLPGLYAISTDSEGERSFLYWRENSAARRMFQDGGDVDFSPLAAFDVVYLSAISLAILPAEVREAFFEFVAGFRARGGRFVFDSNYRPKLWPDAGTAQAAVERAWGLTDIALPSVDDEIALFGDADQVAALARIRRVCPGQGALKRGAEGPVALQPVEGEAPVFEPAAKVVDTTAAGDSFNGGFLAEFLVSGDVNAAMLAGHWLASRVVGCRGAIIPR